MKAAAMAADRVLRHSVMPEVGLEEFDLPRAEMALDVLQLAAAQVVDDRDPGASGHQRIHQMRPDERRAACDQDRTVFPIHLRSSILSRTVSAPTAPTPRWRRNGSRPRGISSRVGAAPSPAPTTSR